MDTVGDHFAKHRGLWLWVPDRRSLRSLVPDDSGLLFSHVRSPPPGEGEERPSFCRVGKAKRAHHFSHRTQVRGHGA